MQTSGKDGKMVFIFDLGHMNKLATMPIDGKNFKKKSSPEPLGLGASSTKFI